MSLIQVLDQIIVSNKPCNTEDSASQQGSKKSSKLSVDKAQENDNKK
jgi:hypothetical protein